MSQPTIEIYASLDCPFAYLAAFRLRQVWPEFEGRVRLVWRALSLEYVNERPVVKPLIEAERDLFARIEPQLPYELWPADGWNWPVTMWPAFEALACAQAQGHEAAMATSWALRRGFFVGGRNVALRHELLNIARDVAREAPLDVGRFEEDWDQGRYKATVIEESRRGWHELALNGSATFVLPDGRQVTNPALGEIDFDEETYQLRHFRPYEGDPAHVYRQLLQSAL